MRWITPVTLLAAVTAAACSAAPDASEGDAVPLPESAREDGVSTSCGQVVYVAFDGATLQADSGASDAVHDRTFLVTSTKVVPPFDATGFGYGSRQATIDAILARVRATYAPYEITFVTERPTSGPYTTMVVGGGTDGTVAPAWSWGIAPFDAGNSNRGDIGIVFTANPAFSRTAASVARVLSHELGHSLGMAHIQSKASVMEPFCVCADDFVAGTTTNEPGFGWQTNVWEDQPAMLHATLGAKGSCPLATRGDVDGDGLADVVAFDPKSNGLETFRGDKSGSLHAAIASGTADSALWDGSGEWLAEVADVSGDGRADLISVASTGSALVRLGGASGAFGPAVASFAGTLTPAYGGAAGHRVAGVADVTGDGRADLVTWYAKDASAYVFPGRADGSFGDPVASFAGTLAVSTGATEGHLLAGVADVTGDGRADLVTVHTAGTAYVFPGRADGSFGDAVASFAGTLDPAAPDGKGHDVVALADVTGDGRADLVTAHVAGGTAYVFPGRADGSFGDAVASFAGTLDVASVDGAGHEVVAALDVTGDGRADLVTIHEGGTAFVFPGRADGTFGDAVGSLAGAVAPGQHHDAGLELVQASLDRRKGL